MDEKLPHLPRKIASRDSTNSDSDANNGPLYSISQVKKDDMCVGELCGLLLTLMNCGRSRT